MCLKFVGNWGVLEIWGNFMEVILGVKNRDFLGVAQNPHITSTDACLTFENNQPWLLSAFSCLLINDILK